MGVRTADPEPVDQRRCRQPGCAMSDDLTMTAEQTPQTYTVSDPLRLPPPSVTLSAACGGSVSGAANVPGCTQALGADHIKITELQDDESSDFPLQHW